MQDRLVSVFDELVTRHFAFLVSAGFHRSTQQEERGATAVTRVYLGRHVGFVVALDRRAESASVDVMRVVSRSLVDDPQVGGFCAPLLTYLIEHRHVRALPHVGDEARTTDAVSHIESEITIFAQLLSQHGQKLLEDTPESLPANSPGGVV